MNAIVNFLDIGDDHFLDLPVAKDHPPKELDVVSDFALSVFGDLGPKSFGFTRAEYMHRIWEAYNSAFTLLMMPRLVGHEQRRLKSRCVGYTSVFPLRDQAARKFLWPKTPDIASDRLSQFQFDSLSIPSVDETVKTPANFVYIQAIALNLRKAQNKLDMDDQVNISLHSLARSIERINKSPDARIVAEGTSPLGIRWLDKLGFSRCPTPSCEGNPLFRSRITPDTQLGAVLESFARRSRDNGRDTQEQIVIP